MKPHFFTLFTFFFVSGVIGAGVISKKSEETKLAPIDEISVNFRGGTEVPTPTLIYNAGQWYFLDHLSSGLVYFDHERKVFRPLIAEKWETRTPLEHRFYLRKDAKFHDGTPIFAKDVVATIKNQLISKTSTHFPLWEYLIDCDDLKNISDHCEGVQVIDMHTIDFKFQKPMTSFYLQLASPETGIWSSDDLPAPPTRRFKPQKFSGPYFFDYEESAKNTAVVLRKNINSPLIDIFKKAPNRINSFHFTRSEAVREFNKGTLDLFVDYYQPFPEVSVAKEAKIYRSTPTMMTYLRSVRERPQKHIGREFLEYLWKAKHGQDILPAYNFLAPGVEYNLTKEEFLQTLPKQKPETITVGFISSFHTPDLALFLQRIGREADVDLIFKELDFPTFIEYFERKKNDLDFLLAPYAASERFPSVHLRFLTGPLSTETPVFDLKTVETPEMDANQVLKLKQYQKWLLKKQLSIPLFFHATEIYFNTDIDIGEQPKTDAEFELWRVTKK